MYYSPARKTTSQKEGLRREQVLKWTFSDFFIPKVVKAEQFGLRLEGPKHSLVTSCTRRLRSRVQRGNRKIKGTNKTEWEGDRFIRLIESDPISKFTLTAPAKEHIRNIKNRSSLKRAEGAAKAVIDSIFLSDVDSYASGVYRKKLAELAFKVFTMSLFNDVEHVVKYWKAYGTYLLRSSNGLVATLQANNPFRCLNSFPVVTAILLGDKKKKTGEALAHLISSRQFPEPDRLHLKAGLISFRTTTTTPWTPHDKKKTLDEIFNAARGVAENIPNRYQLMSEDLKTHLSLCASASYESSVKVGGRAKYATKTFRGYITQCPDKPEFIETPLGEVYCPAGEPRWKHWFRYVDTHRETRQVSEAEAEWRRVSTEIATNQYLTCYVHGGMNRGLNTFEYKGHLASLKQRQENLFRMMMGRVNRFGYHHVLPSHWDGLNFLQETKFTQVGKPTYAGLDCKYGLQLWVYTWIRKETNRKIGQPPRSKLVPLPEVGFKNRVLGITEWWNSIYQQPFGHILRKLLYGHKFATTGLIRSDQAWAFLRDTKGYKASGFKPVVLCSDLKEATDHIPFEVARTMWEGFLPACGAPKWFVDEILSIIGPRDIDTKDLINPFRTQRGIMMGEPIAKATLCLHQLCVEQEAYVRSRHLPRSYHVGGDDVIAIGPQDYCDRITHNLVEWGGELSPEKHNVTPQWGKYCERLFDIPLLLEGKGQQMVFKDYPNSGWIESVKVRLLSPGLTTRDKFNEGNPAIGKGKSLMECLQNLPVSSYPVYNKILIRDWFLWRMGTYLPDPKLVPWEYSILCLPKDFGGMGLAFAEELPKIRTCPAIKKLIQAIYYKHPKLADIVEDFRRYPTAGTFRGCSFSSEDEHRIWRVLTTPDESQDPCAGLLSAGIENEANFLELMKAFNQLNSRGGVAPEARHQQEFRAIFDEKSESKRISSERKKKLVPNFRFVHSLDKTFQTVKWADGGLRSNLEISEDLQDQGLFSKEEVVKIFKRSELFTDMILGIDRPTPFARLKWTTRYIGLWNRLKKLDIEEVKAPDTQYLSANLVDYLAKTCQSYVDKQAYDLSYEVVFPTEYGETQCNVLDMLTWYSPSLQICFPRHAAGSSLKRRLFT